MPHPLQGVRQHVRTHISGRMGRPVPVGHRRDGERQRRLGHHTRQRRGPHGLHVVGRPRRRTRG